MAVAPSSVRDFLDSTPEDANHNQYWYSPATVTALVNSALALSVMSGRRGRIAFVSTPSLYFALPSEMRAGHAVLDIDEQWQRDPGFIRFDFNAGAAALPDAARGAFDVVVVDPPFITEPVWRAYADACRALLNASGAVLCTTVAENAPLLASLFPGARSVPFQPSIPRLVYQYDTFCSAEELPAPLTKKNPEIP
jgi:hypothetical protein